jgi:RNA polymerase sigma-70 factor (ECF subfamily)
MSMIKVHIPRSSAKLRKLSDEELMVLVCHHEAVALEVVLERHLDESYSLAYRMMGRRSLAERVVEEALLSIWREGTRYDSSRGSVRNWILAITHRRAVEALRSGGPRIRDGAEQDDAQDAEQDAAQGDLQDAAPGELREEVGSPAPSGVEMARQQEAERLRTALEQLPPEQGRVLELAYFGGFTDTEIAAMLELPIGTINDRMRLGLEQMRDRLSLLEAVL